MGAQQIAQMEPGISEVYKGINSPDDPPTACCTLEATNLSGAEVWIQAMPGTINMSYPPTEEPLGLLRRQAIVCPPDLYLVEWKAGEYATFGFSNISAREHAFLIDQLFVKILACDDEGYELRMMIEPLET